MNGHPSAVDEAGAELDEHFRRKKGGAVVFQRWSDAWWHWLEVAADGFVDRGPVSVALEDVLDRFPHDWTLLFALEEGPSADLLVHWIDPGRERPVYLGGGSWGDEALVGALVGMGRVFVAAAGGSGVGG